MGPVTQADGHDAPGLVDEGVPGMAAVVEQVVMGCEDPVGEPVVAHELPEVLDRVQFGTFGRQRHESDVGGHGEVMRQVPSRLVEDDDGVPTWADLCGNLGQVQGHGFGVAGGQDEGRTLSLLRTDGAEDVGRGGALVAWCRGSRAPPGPAPGDLVLLADASLIGEPDLYLIAAEALLAGDLLQTRGEGFLKSAMAPSTWA
jgi:hypothetical protein